MRLNKLLIKVRCYCRISSVHHAVMRHETVTLLALISWLFSIGLRRVLSEFITIGCTLVWGGQLACKESLFDADNSTIVCKFS